MADRVVALTTTTDPPGEATHWTAGAMAAVVGISVFNTIKHFRRIATRYEKHAASYLAMLKLASTSLWLGYYDSVT